ncbi:hypothetical protein CKO15_09835 [Halorhodospira abdelmalekii]|uniref:hypothetical protein n=1 Tax=Halorhodospira abdelmalekii TaxID=421629 RepID=UPI001906C2E1|nr:hypothetical protein [Halorhodospira abdelmalekii]MBK1735578.1 hypothetical protein [Halorhodospira abdelmalekii]
MDMRAIDWEAEACGLAAEQQLQEQNDEFYEPTPGYHAAQAAVLQERLYEASATIAWYQQELAWSQLYLERAKKWEHSARSLLEQWHQLPPRAHKSRALRFLEPRFTELNGLRNQSTGA